MCVMQSNRGIQRLVKNRVSVVTTILVAASILTSVQNAQGDERAAHACKTMIKSIGLVAQFTHDGYELGTGVLVNENERLMVTAGHVVGDGSNLMIFSPQVDANGKVIARRSYYIARRQSLGISAKVLVRDRTRDVAIIQLERLPDGVRAVPLAGKSPEQGQTVYAMGNSGSDDDDSLWRYRGSEVGQVCQKSLHTTDGTINALMFETVIASNHGDSGGPLVNDRGELVGITISHHGNGKEEDVGQHVGFCTDVTEIREVLGRAMVALGVPVESGGISRTNQDVPFMFPRPARDWRLPVLSDPTPFKPAFLFRSAKVNSGRAVPAASFLSQGANDSVDVTARFNVLGCKGRNCEAIFTLADQNGKVIRNFDGHLIQQRIAIRPGFDNTIFAEKDLKASFLTGLIHLVLGVNENRYSFLVSIRDVDSGTWLTTAGYRIDYYETEISSFLP